MSDEHSKTQSIFLISQNVEDLKRKSERSEERLTALEIVGGQNSVHHQNTHSKLNDILAVCKDTSSRVSDLEVFMIGTKAKWKLIGTLAGLLGGISAFLIKTILDLIKGSH